MEKRKKNAKRFLFAGFTVCFVILLVLAGCPTDSNSSTQPEPEPITWTVEQEGGTNYTADSTAIRIKFSEEVKNLLAREVSITGEAAIAGEFTPEGNDWIIPITVSAADVITVSITRKGIEANPKYVGVYKAGEWTPFVYNISVNGTANTVSTTALTFTFDYDLDDKGGLDASEINITNGSGSATKGVLIGSGKVWVLSIYTSAGGTINVAITNDNIFSASQTVTVFYKPHALAPEKPSIGKMENGLHFTDDVDLSSQAAIDAIVTLVGDPLTGSPQVADPSKVRANIALVWTGMG
ncbi:MAG: hypothetical protein LBG91_00910, partial [Treponema sp.]|nr:hypothetical protein [Treponema sp.]